MLALQRCDYAPGARQDAHTHPTPTIAMLVRGSLFERSGTGTRNGQPGDVSIKPAGVLHDDLYGAAGATIFKLTIDQDLGPYRWTFGGAANALFTRAVIAWRDNEPWREWIFDAIAALETGAQPASARMREVAERVTITSDAVEIIARDLAMHPVALARAFRRAHGCSITSYRRRVRVRRAASLLGVKPLADVAYECGFSDQSHFCRQFKLELGVTPAAFRGLIRSRSAPADARY
jgi:AraC-like DNA-binding protein